MTATGKRPYRMRARAEAMSATRQQIIDAAAERLRASPAPLTLLEVAARAGVSRTTLYRHFASVTELLDAVGADLLARAGFGELLAALERPDPVDALRAVIGRGTAIWALDARLVRNMMALAAVQPEAVPVIEQLELGRVQAMTRLVERIAGAGRLRPGLGRGRAVDLLAVVTSFATWDQLTTRQRRGTRAARTSVIDLATRAVVRD
jgi:AcrR family transcriptional regulator